MNAFTNYLWMPTVYYSVFMGGDDMLEASEKKL